MAIRVRPLEPDDLPIIEELFGPRGACAGCWCMYWRLGSQEWQAAKGAPNREAFLRLVADGEVHGLLAFEDEEPVGWCNIGPRSDFPRLGRSRVLATGRGEGTWGVPCFFIPAKHRRRGVATALLKAAVALARERGARCLEGYPVTASKNAPPGSSVPAAFAWTGVPELFESAGFRDVTPEGSTRPIYLRSFRPSRTARKP